ncbi:MAG TPA: 4'-phosphopantetheinyl transferase superfamily protein [Methylocella sp.]|nr:4'-phosphopantetheinyl transferase superfamily protein [Methylocella sp.]
MRPDQSPLALEGIHLWVLDLSQKTRDLGVLSQEEEARASRFVNALDRKRFRAAHQLLRQILARYLGEPPQALVFGATAAGKPYLQAPGRLPPLAFNLAHSAGLGLLALCLEREVGADIEALTRLEDLPGVAREIMSPAEWQSFQAVPRELAHDVFFGLWTRKEALLKAAGTGLSFDPREIHLGLAPGRAAKVAFQGKIWSVAPVEAAPGAKAAAAIEGPLPEIRIFRA